MAKVAPMMEKFFDELMKELKPHTETYNVAMDYLVKAALGSNDPEFKRNEGRYLKITQAFRKRILNIINKYFPERV